MNAWFVKVLGQLKNKTKSQASKPEFFLLKNNFHIIHKTDFPRWKHVYICGLFNSLCLVWWMQTTIFVLHLWPNLNSCLSSSQCPSPWKKGCEDADWVARRVIPPCHIVWVLGRSMHRQMQFVSVRLDMIYDAGPPASRWWEKLNLWHRPTQWSSEIQ